MRYVYVLLFLLSLPQLHAQDISGKWVGNYGRNFFTTQPLKLELDLTVSKDSIVRGMSHLYYRNDKYEHYYISGIYHKQDSTLVVREDSSAGVSISIFATNVLGAYTLKLHRTDSSIRFDGRWKENGGGISSSSSVWLERPMPRKQDATKPIAKEEKLDRLTSIQKFIEIDKTEKDSIKIMLVDNGQIDGDIVSVYMNDSVLLSNQPLTGKSQILWVSVSKDMPSCRIAMIAESQGSIPPCTARMTVVTKKKFYNIDLSSDTKSSGTVQLFLKE